MSGRTPDRVYPATNPPSHAEFTRKVDLVLGAIRETLIEKNQAYGNSALEPVRVFSKADATEQIKVRIDDKLSRLMRGRDLGEDTVLDLVGYLVLLRIAQMDSALIPFAGVIPMPQAASKASRAARAQRGLRARAEGFSP